MPQQNASPLVARWCHEANRWEEVPKVTPPLFSPSHPYRAPPGNLQMNHLFCMTFHRAASLQSLNIMNLLHLLTARLLFNPVQRR